MKSLAVGLALLCCTVSAFSKEECRATRDYRAPTGRLTSAECSDQNNKKNASRYWIAVDGAKVLEDRALYEITASKDGTIWIYYGPSSREIGCSEFLYLIDLNYKPVKVIQFGVKNACNEFDWVSWGQKNSVIALKKDVRFIYKDGKVIPPKDMEHLWTSMIIPVPRGKTAADQPYPNYIVPYAKELPLPPQ